MIERWGAWERFEGDLAVAAKILLDYGAIAQYQTTPLLLEVYPTSPRESRDPNQPIANFRCINVAPDPIFWVIPTKITFSDKKKENLEALPYEVANKLVDFSWLSLLRTCF
ncbi:hypothetical protein WN51_09258 [Melipona quadrifasciata]|uniref:Uncharacterized protein n=1 Tax=Melipona quadrifasciata TaxID=166423 RepID=A0A0N0U6E6_9HYME|nr:hypothetical protein WN51_09258 [Melipona quadrifasciata]